jgi:hypothetical protein
MSGQQWHRRFRSLERRSSAIRAVKLVGRRRETIPKVIVTRPKGPGKTKKGR